MDHVLPGILFHRGPTAPEIPLVFDSPHSGTDYPDDFGYSCRLDLLRSAEDLFVDELFGTAPAHGATLIGALFPRSYLDVNRALADLDQQLLDAPWPEPLSPGEKTRAGMGLVRRLVRPEMPVYDRKLSVAEVKSRIRTRYLPYHDELQSACDRLHRKFGIVWHVDCHSMQSVGTSMHADGAGSQRADFVLGDRDGTTCAPELTGFVARVLRGRGYDVRINDPYKGVELVRRHGHPARNRHSIQIEVNRRLYMDETRFEKNGNWPRLADDMGHLVEALAGFARRDQVDE